MGQKVHLESIRVGYIHDWKSNWFNKKNSPTICTRTRRSAAHRRPAVARRALRTIRKNATEVEVNIHTARPGIVIGKSGSEVDQLRRDLHRITGKQVKVNILEIKRPELDARLVAQSIAEQLQNRVAFRRAMKRALTSAMRSGAKGVKVQVSGRLGGAEMARTEGYSDGRVPLHTLRADIDYGFHEARTTFGRIGVKCWINKGEIMPEGYTGADLTIMDDPGPQAPDRGGRDGRRGRDGRGRGGGGRARRRPGWRRRSRWPGGPGGRGRAAPVVPAVLVVPDGAWRSARRSGGGGGPGGGGGGGGGSRGRRCRRRRRWIPRRRSGGPAAAAVDRRRRRCRRWRRRSAAAAAAAVVVPRRWRWRPRRRGPGGGGRGGGGGQGGQGGRRRGRRTRSPPAAAVAVPAAAAEAVAAARAGQLMLAPKRVKHRKQHRGRRAGLSRGQVKVQFGEYGLKALDAGWLTNRQIEAARIAMTRKIRRGGKVWINVYPDKSFTKKPAETRMGSGKGSPEGWVAVVKPGRVMFELAGVPEPLAREAMRLAGHKLPVRTKFVLREDG